MTTPHLRRCFNCGNVAEHADSVVPHVLCNLCGSQDTRRIKTLEPVPFHKLPPTPENLQQIGWEADEKYLESPYGFDSCFLSRSNDDGVWRITRFCDEIQIPTPATMGDVMDLCRLLGIPVKEIT